MMAAVKAKDTGPEMILRKKLFSRGFRYRIHVRSLPGNPDIVFPSARVVVFVDGDFWHGKGWEERGLSSFEEQFPTNRGFWVAKIQRNVERDREVTEALGQSGWLVLRFLASKVESDPDGIADSVSSRVLERQNRSM